MPTTVGMERGMPSGQAAKTIAIILSVLAVGSIVSGYVREMVLASTFGAGTMADAYLSVMTITRLVCDIGPAAVLLAGIVPVVSSLSARAVGARAHVFVVTLGVTLAATSLLALALDLLMPMVLTALAPGFDETARAVGLAISSAIVWFLPLQSATVLFSLFLNAQGRFMGAATAPVAANLAFIGVLLATEGHPPVDRLWMATLLGPGLTAVVLGLLCWRTGLFQPARSDTASDALRSLRKIAGPVLLSLGLAGSAGLLLYCQLLVRRYGSMTGEGSVASLAYAFRIYEVPVSLTANVAATMVLPALSRLHAEGQLQRMTDICRGLLEWGLLLLAPMAVIVYLEAPFLVDLLFGYGRFTASDVERTAAALRGFAPVIVFEAGIVVFYRVLYALRRTRVALGVSVVVVAVLVAALAVGAADSERDLALVFSGSFAVGMGILAVFLFRHFGQGVIPFSGHLTAIAVLMGMCLLTSLVPLPQAPPLVGGTVFLVLYGLAFLLLLPSHRSAMFGLLRRRAVAR